MVLFPDDRIIIDPFTVLGDGIVENDAVLNVTTLDTHFNNNGQGGGSGFVIAPNYVISVAHNAYRTKSPIKYNNFFPKYEAIRATLSTEENNLLQRTFQSNPSFNPNGFGKGETSSTGVNDPDANITSGNVNFLVDYFPDSTGENSAREKDIAIFKTNSDLLSAPEIYVGIMAFVDPLDAISYEVNSAGYPGDNVGNIPGSSLGSGRDLVFISGEITDTPYSNRFAIFSDTFDAASGQSGSGIWHTPKTGDLLEGDKSRILGVLSSELGGVGTGGVLIVGTGGVLITEDIYQTMMLAMKDDTKSLADDLPENAIIGSSSNNDNITGTYSKERILGQEGNDTLSGGGADDRLEGGAGNDILSGENDNDLLEGGAGNDFLDGGDNSNVPNTLSSILGFNVGSSPGTDIAVFSDNLQNYDITSGSNNSTVVTHNTGTDGTDTLSNIEIAQFSDGDTDLKEGSPNTKSAEAPPTSTNFFDPGIPVNLNLTLPVSTVDGDAEYNLNISQIAANPQYNIGFIIDTSASMSVNPADFQNVKDAYTNLINYFKSNGIAENTNFGVVSFSKNATLYEDLTADQAISTIQGLTTAPAIEGTQYRQALGKGLDFFTQSPLNGENVTNLAYFVSDGRSRSTYPEPTYHDNARFLRSVANVQAFGIDDGTLGFGAVADSQINFVDSEQGAIVNSSSDLDSAFAKSGLIDDIDEIKILQDNSVVATIQPNQLTDTPFGLNYTGTIDNLDVSLNAANDISAEVSFIANSSIASSESVDFTVASGLDNSGVDPLTNVAVGSSGDEEIILSSIDLGASGDAGKDTLVGNNFGNVLDGGAGDDSLYGNNGNDTITGGGGENLIDGGADDDTVVYASQAFATATINLTANPTNDAAFLENPSSAMTVIEQKGSVTKINDLDTLVNVEYLQFSDVRVSTDTLEIVPILEGTDVTTIEGDSGTTIAQFTVNLDTSTSNSVEFAYETANLGAVAGEDYTAASGIFTIAPGSTSATIDVEIAGDIDYESDEDFALNLSAITGATFKENKAEYSLFANIENDDPEPIIDPTAPTTQTIIEYGTIANLDHNLQSINLTNEFINPVVFAQPLSSNENETAAVRLQNIDRNSFEIQVQEAEYLDGIHAAETVSYFVIEAGNWQLPDGTILQAENIESDKLISEAWNTIFFDEQFNNTPGVFTQVQTNNDPDFVRTRQKNLTTESFQFGMEETEAQKNSGHGNETLGWFAIESGNGDWSGNNYQVGNTGDKVTHNWRNINFASSFSQAPNFLASLSSYDGTDPAGVRYRSLDRDSLEIKVEEDKSNDPEIIHTTDKVSFMALEGAGTIAGQSLAVSEAPQQVFAETGKIDLTDVSATINLTNTYNNPVVFLQPPSFNDSAPATVRLDNVTANSFDARIQEPDYLVNAGEGSHGLETVSYFVFETGTWLLEDGALLEVGTTVSDGLVEKGTQFDTVNFSSEFGSSPVVISQLQTENDADFVRTRQRKTTTTGFQVAMEEEEANSNSGRGSETIGWLAMESGSGQWENFTYYADRTGDRIRDTWSNVEFDSLFTQEPQFLAGISTYDGIDSSGLRYNNLSATGVEIKIEEEKSLDSETRHTTDNVDFLLIEGTGSLNATPIDLLPSNSLVSQNELFSDRFNAEIVNGIE